MLFALKKAVSRLLFPIPLSLLLLLAGLIAAWRMPQRGRRRTLALTLLITGMVLLTALSTLACADLLLRRLESQYPELGPEVTAAIDWEQVHNIAVLAGGAVAFDDQPITRQVDLVSLARLMEGVRLYQQCPDCRLILMGGGPGMDLTAPDDTLTNYRLVVEYGVAPEDIVIERESWDTDDQARILNEMLGDAPVILVTSASHMPRTMALTAREGMTQVIAAPADFRTGLYGVFSREAFTVDSVYPNATALWYSERAIYEYLGLAWLALTG